ncbi:MAG: dockerin type I repeat-containing protein [Phycisphaerae bacterium]
MAKYYVHGVSYVDERLFMYNDDFKRPFYYALERMYSVWAILDRTGAIVERVMYDGYGRPYIRESAGLGDMNNDSVLDSTDATRVAAAIAGSIWDPRADVNGDGVVDGKDQDSYDEKEPTWQDWPGNDLVVAQTFSDVDNGYMFQGVPHVALDATNSVTDKAPLNHHRARYADPAIGRWGTRDPLHINPLVLAPRWNDLFLQRDEAFERSPLASTSSLAFLMSNPLVFSDASGQSESCGYITCLCPNGNRPLVEVHGNSHRAAFIAALRGWRDVFVTLPGLHHTHIYSTYGCEGAMSAQATLEHECGHACDLASSFIHYVVGACAELAPGCGDMGGLTGHTPYH